MKFYKKNEYVDLKDYFVYKCRGNIKYFILFQ